MREGERERLMTDCKEFTHVMGGNSKIHRAGGEERQAGALGHGLKHLQAEFLLNQGNLVFVLMPPTD